MKTFASKILLVLGVAVFAGCAFDPTGLASDRDLSDAIQNFSGSPEEDLTSDMAEQIAAPEFSAAGEEFGIAGAPAARFAAWGRVNSVLLGSDRTITSSDPVAGTAQAAAAKSFSGTLVIYSNAAAFRNRSSALVASKDFKVTRTMNYALKKEAGRWRVTGNSFSVTASDAPKVKIEWMKIYAPTTSITPVFTADENSMAEIRSVGSLPSLPAGAPVRVEAKVSASGTTPLAWIKHNGLRVTMNEIGSSGVFAGQFKTGAGVKRLHLDVLDAATINNPSNRANYGGVMWSLVFP